MPNICTSAKKPFVHPGTHSHDIDVDLRLRCKVRNTRKVRKLCSKPSVRVLLQRFGLLNQSIFSPRRSSPNSEHLLLSTPGTFLAPTTFLGMVLRITPHLLALFCCCGLFTQQQYCSPIVRTGICRRDGFGLSVTYAMTYLAASSRSSGGIGSFRSLSISMINCVISLRARNISHVTHPVRARHVRLGVAIYWGVHDSYRMQDGNPEGSQSLTAVLGPQRCLLMFCA